MSLEREEGEVSDDEDGFETMMAVEGSKEYGWLLYDVKPSEARIVRGYFNQGIALTRAVDYAKANLTYCGYRLAVDTPEVKIWQTKNGERDIRLLRLEVLPAPDRPRALVVVRCNRIESDFSLYANFNTAMEVGKEKMQRLVNCNYEVKKKRLGKNEVMWFSEARPLITVHVRSMSIFCERPKRARKK